jgi:hypothetical protein
MSPIEVLAKTAANPRCTRVLVIIACLVLAARAEAKPRPQAASRIAIKVPRGLLPKGSKPALWCQAMAAGSHYVVFNHHKRFVELSNYLTQRERALQRQSPKAARYKPLQQQLLKLGQLLVQADALCNPPSNQDPTPSPSLAPSPAVTPSPNVSPAPEPRLAFSRPADGEMLFAPANLQVSVDSSTWTSSPRFSTIAKVQFFVDGMLHSEDSSAPYEALIVEENPTTRSIRAVARNALGELIDQAAIAVSITRPPETKIQLPIEMISAEPSAQEISFWLSARDLLSNSDQIEFHSRIFGLDYQNKARIEVNDQFGLNLNNSTVKMTARQKAFEGIGGAYSTLYIRFSIPKSALQVGNNVLRFRYTGTDGTSIGYRVLEFNLKGAVDLIPSERFVYEDPDTWTAPYPDAASIEAGKKLWSERQLLSSNLQGATPIRARCKDCHVDDGYDLKYFSYSNRSIIERSKFHGMSEHEGRLVASYIRSLQAPNPGRPWDPPYQPGPGIDSRPPSEWAAGAGVEWVLEDDSASFNYLFKDGVPREIDISKNLNHREVPIAIELPVWNHWLPRIHPVDYYGDTFYDFGPGKVKPVSCYQGAVAALSKLGPTATGKALYDTLRAHWWECAGYLVAHGLLSDGVLNALMPPEDQWSERDSTARYGVLQWSAVKTWGMMRRFNIEGHARNAAQAGYSYFTNHQGVEAIPERHWDYGRIFTIAPHMLHLPNKGHGIRNGSPLMWNYFSASWYYLQLILDSNNHRGDGATHWPYLLAFAGLGAGQSSGAATTVISLIKMMEAYNNPRLPSAGPASAWQAASYIHLLGTVSPASVSRYREMNDDLYFKVFEALHRTHLKRTKLYTREQLRVDGYFSSTPVTDLSSHGDSLYANQRYYHVLRELVRTNRNGRTFDPALTNEMLDFGKYLWPEIADKFEELRRPAT